MHSFLTPISLEQALKQRAENPSYTLIAGGTDLMVATRDAPPKSMISLFGLPELCGITTSEEGIRIGAATTYAQLLGSEIIAQRFTLLHQACQDVGATQIQARGTLGGNIATSSPVGDGLPPLLVLNARLELASARGGTRLIPYNDFLVGYRQTALAPDEILVAIHLPFPSSNAVQYWRKVGTRRAQSISKVMMASVACVSKNTLTQLRVAFGAVAETTVRVPKTEAVLIGHVLSPKLVEEALTVLREEITPIDDVRSEAAYRLGVACNVLRSFLLSLVSS